jgi:hypothetical protein
MRGYSPLLVLWEVNLRTENKNDSILPVEFIHGSWYTVEIIHIDSDPAGTAAAHFEKPFHEPFSSP